MHHAILKGQASYLLKFVYLYAILMLNIPYLHEEYATFFIIF